MKRLLTILLVIPLILFASAAFGIQYFADDWCQLGYSYQYGTTGIVRYLYDSWTGRYTSSLEMGLLSIFTFPPLATLLAFAICLAALIALFRRHPYGLMGALMLLTVTITATPDIMQSIYWSAGALLYPTSIALFCVLLWALNRPLAALLAPLLTFVIAGTNEVIAVTQIVVLAAYWLLQKGNRKPISLALVAAFIGLVVSLAAPGNAIRRAYFPPSDFWLAIVFSARATGVPFAHALRQAPVAVLALLTIPALAAGLGRSLESEERSHLRLKLLIVLSSVIAVNFVSMFTTYFGTGVPLALRAQMVPAFLTLLGGMYISWLAGCLLNRQPKLRFASVLIIVLAVACTISALSINSSLWSQPRVKAQGQTIADLYRICDEQILD